MVLSLKKRSPIRDGIYPVKLLDVEVIKGVVTKGGIRDKYEFSFLLFSEEGELEFTCSLFWSSYERSSFAQFVNCTKANFGLTTDDELDTDNFVGKTVSAAFSTYRGKNGDEYLSLQSFAPYNNTMEVNSNDSNIN